MNIKVHSHKMPSVQFSCSVVSDSLQPHELQHARPPCPSPTPRVYPKPCPSSRWCHPAITSSFSSCPQSFPAIGSFPMSQHFAWGGQSIEASDNYVNIIRSTVGYTCLGTIATQKVGIEVSRYSASHRCVPGVCLCILRLERSLSRLTEVNRASVKYNIDWVLTRSKHLSAALVLSHLISATNEVQRG